MEMFIFLWSPCTCFLCSYSRNVFMRYYLFSRRGSVLYIFKNLSSPKMWSFELSHQKRRFPLHPRELLSLHPKPVQQPTPPVAIHTHTGMFQQRGRQGEGQWVVWHLWAATAVSIYPLLAFLSTDDILEPITYTSTKDVMWFTVRKIKKI